MNLRKLEVDLPDHDQWVNGQEKGWTHVYAFSNSVNGQWMTKTRDDENGAMLGDASQIQVIV